MIDLFIGAFVIMTAVPLLAYVLLAACCYATLAFVRTCDLFAYVASRLFPVCVPDLTYMCASIRRIRGAK